ncbi:MAG: flagellar hook protein FlgE [Clostridiales bacterium]|nr:flagellar hook protein FlgE [Clostridiales bacterium]
MLRSLYSGVSGLKNHQTKMDVIGNNIANVNTVGFKSSRVTFQDIYSQTLKPASAPAAGSGGTNPQQIGLGVSVGTIDTMFTRSAAEYTGSPLDLSIEGDGFFVVNDGAADYFTRAGNFTTDADSNLINANGLIVQGWMAAPITADHDADPATPDAITGYNPIDPADMTAANLNNIQMPEEYYDITISKTGEIIGINSITQDRDVIGRIAIANFNNQNALSKMGNNLYDVSQNSGLPQIGAPGVDGTAYLNPSALEMSNVDLAKEFTDMIITQRGFQANSRVITTSDSLLEELVNLKR